MANDFFSELHSRTIRNSEKLGSLSFTQLQHLGNQFILFACKRNNRSLRLSLSRSTTRKCQLLDWPRISSFLEEIYFELGISLKVCVFPSAYNSEIGGCVRCLSFAEGELRSLARSNAISHSPLAFRFPPVNVFVFSLELCTERQAYQNVFPFRFLRDSYYV